MLTAKRELTASCRRLRRQLVDVGSRHKGLLACTGDDDDADGVVVLECKYGTADFVDCLRAEGVENLRTIDRDGGSGAVAFDQDVLERFERHDEESSIPHRRAAPASQPIAAPIVAPMQSARTS